MSQMHCGPIQIDARRMNPNCTVLDRSITERVIGKMTAWLGGAPVNTTENKAAMHMALRAGEQSGLPYDYVNKSIAARALMAAAIARLGDGNILHIGVGGSDSGPRLVVDALRCSAPPMRQAYFLSSLTPEAINEVRVKLNPLTDHIILASKSFATDEILILMHLFATEFGFPVSRMLAATAAPDKAQEAGIASDNILPFFDWVGGRFSVWSSVGFVIAATYGMEVFTAFLAGAAEIDADVMTKMEQSAAFKLAIILSNQRRLMNRTSLAVLPYHAHLALLPTYIQQMFMESNGKGAWPTAGPVVFGLTGTEFQHSFGQFLHQGPDTTLSLIVDVLAKDEAPWAAKARERLHVNAQAQADILWHGAPNEAEPHKHLAGGRPSILMTLPDLAPRSLGALLALIEYVTVIDAFINDLNPFDQWGVEAGKKLAQDRFKNGS